jgi:CubicO group peptidase (beta-lactamase class C family)
MMDSLSLQPREMTREKFPRTWVQLDAGLASKVAPGFVVGLWQKKDPDVIWQGACGNRRLLPSVLPMLPDTVFDFGSVSKVFATATLAAVLVERGWLDWDTPLSAVLKDYPFKNIEIRHLLSHTAGLVWWEPYWARLKDYFAPEPLYSISVRRRQAAMRSLVMATVPEAAPGEKFVYSDPSFLLLGFALEEITQMPLDRAVQKFVWDPMGVRGAFYRRVRQPPSKGTLNQVAATEVCTWRGGVLQGQVHDDNCWAMGGYGGHTGAFGTARDLLHFVRSLLGGFLSPVNLRAIWTPVNQPPGCERTLGWDTPSGEASSTGTLFSRHSVGHLGFVGTSLWIDLDAKLAVVLLSNRVHPSREHNQMKVFRPLLHEALRLDLASLTKS